MVTANEKAAHLATVPATVARCPDEILLVLGYRRLPVSDRLAVRAVIKALLRERKRQVAAPLMG